MVLACGAVAMEVAALACATSVRDVMDARSAARSAHLDRLRAKPGCMVLRMGERCRVGCGHAVRRLMAVVIGCAWVDGSDAVRSRMWNGCVACPVLVG